MKAYFFNFFLLTVIFSTMLFSCSSDQTSGDDSHEKDKSLADKIEEKPTLRFYFTPSLRKILLKEKLDSFVSFLNEEIDVQLEPVVPEDYNAMIEDLGNGQADLAFMNTLSYVSAVKKYEVQARLKSIKYGQTSYRGQIIANSSKGINSLQDINGKTFAFTNKNSTSGFLYPVNILKTNNIKPGKSVFAENHDRVVEMVYRGMADAGATFYSEPGYDGKIRDARAKVLEKYPDVEEKVKIIELTEPIPNDPIVFRKDLDEKLVSKICKAVIKFTTSPEGKKILTELYGTDGFVECSNADYQSMIEAVDQSNFL